METAKFKCQYCERKIQMRCLKRHLQSEVCKNARWVNESLREQDIKRQEEEHAYWEEYENSPFWDENDENEN